MGEGDLHPALVEHALSALRLASSVSTAIVRNDVAVGTSRLSSIALASIAAGPRSAFASPAAAAGGGRAVPAPVGGRKHVLLRHLRPGPDPLPSQVDAQLAAPPAARPVSP